MSAPAEDEVRGGVLRSRRQAVAATFWEHRSFGRSWLSWITSAVILFWPLLGFAQTADFALDRPNPSAAGDQFSAVGEPITESTAGVAAVQLTNDYAHRLVEVTRPEELAPIALVSDQWLAHLQARLSWPSAKRLALLLDVPLALLNTGEGREDDALSYSPPRSGVLGNVRTGLRLGLNVAGPVRSAAEAEVALPTARAGTYLGSDGGSYTLRLHGDVEHGALRAVASVWGRRDFPLEPVLGAEVGARLGVGLTLGRWRVGAEGLAWYSPRTTSARSDAHSEVWGHLAYTSGPWLFRLAGGPGFALGPGTPRVRALLALGYQWGSSSVESGARRPESATAPAGIPEAAAVLVVDERASESARRAAVSRPTKNVSESQSAGKDASEEPTPERCAATDCHSLEVQVGDRVALQQPVLFDSGTDLLPIDVETRLGEVVLALNSTPDLVRVAVEGHTDNVGQESVNLALSRRRAMAVVRWLIAHGVDERRLQVRAFGPRYPRFDNNTEEGRALNRRVEFTVVERNALGERAWHTGPVQPNGRTEGAP